MAHLLDTHVAIHLRDGDPAITDKVAAGRVALAPWVITHYNIDMKVGIRKIGNSLGVILPRPVLESWGVGEGDQLEVTDKGVRPRRKGGLAQQALDELKRSIALAVVRDFTPAQIRAQILANLHRWRKQGAWVSAYDEWLDIARRGDDGELFAAMLGRDDTATRLRESMPFVGLLPQSEVRRLHEEASARSHPASGR